MTSALRPWWQFTKERFEPRSHAVMIAFFVIIHAVAAGQILGARITGPRFVLAIVLAVLFFFKLRLYDEIKDYETDLEFNPGRPLARGLLSLGHVRIAIKVVIASEILVLIALGPVALLSGVLAIAYSLLMYREFFIGQWLRPRLTSYAVSHTIVCSFLSAALLAALSESSPVAWEWSAWAFILANWFLFNIFEFGRKTFATVEERDRVSSYSKIFGAAGAVVLVMVQAVIASALYAYAFPYLPSRLVLLLSAAILLISGSLYVAHDNPVWAARYRAVSSVYILLAFLSILMVPIFKL